MRVEELQRLERSAPKKKDKTNVKTMLPMIEI